ncbi:hypothetical protein [Methanobrevibacter thaueri]|uniref:Bacterial Ig-like domain (Group 1) n=1 Tax=Methanobrevibacter thaueri TaxID=190975 RepID=A0A315XPD3_9EURY|nr:hypothetical protein [Methanobrevibacter thaueri]PWB88271.1 hypothetical protein MBBTH_01320 [Methanobrevibacter thaueri]
MKKFLIFIVLLIFCTGVVNASDNTSNIQTIDNEYSNQLDDNLRCDDSDRIESEDILKSDDAQSDVPKVYVNASKESNGDGSSWENAKSGSTSWIDSYYDFGVNKIKNGVIYLADGNYTQNNLLDKCSCTFVGQGHNTIISFLGDGGDSHKYKHTFINLTFIPSSFEPAFLSYNFNFINCTFIEIPIILGESQTPVRDGISNVYDIYFNNCKFVNYTNTTMRTYSGFEYMNLLNVPINAHECGNVTLYNCTFEDIISESVIYTKAGPMDKKGNVGGIFITNSTFNNCHIIGIVKAEDKKYCTISNCSYDFEVKYIENNVAPFYINTTDKTEIPLLNTIILINEIENGIIIYLCDEDNTPLEDELAIVINDKLFYMYTDSNGKLILDNLYGYYKFEVDYIGINNYASSNASANFTFDKINDNIENTTINQNTTPSKTVPATDKIVKKVSKITAKKATFKKSKKVKKYTITLKSGKNPIKKVKVLLKVKGKTYKATTNSKGKATFKITKLNKKGKYNAVIKFAGNKNFKPTSKKVKITVKK